MISVIIPVWRDLSAVVACVAQVRKMEGVCEVIVSAASADWEVHLGISPQRLHRWYYPEAAASELAYGAHTYPEAVNSIGGTGAVDSAPFPGINR